MFRLLFGAVDKVHPYTAAARIMAADLMPVIQRLEAGHMSGETRVRELDAAFGSDQDPIAAGVHDAVYDRLFARIVLSAPAPIGVGPALD
jgi:hypothetical protein